MLSKAILQWLRKELPILVSDHVITEFQAEVILSKYQNQFKSYRKKLLYCLAALMGIFLASILLFLIFTA